MALQILAMIVGLLLVSGAALWGLNGLHQDYGLALQGYQELRHVYTVGSHLATAKSLLTLPEPGEAEQQRINREIRAAAQEFDSSLSPSTVISPPASASPSADPLEVIRRGLADAEAAASGPGTMSERLSVQEDAVNRALGGIAELVTTIRTVTESRQEAAVAKRRQTFEAVAGLSAAVVAGGILLGVLQYRSVIRPLRRLSEGVRKIAAGQLSGRVRGTEDRRDEFASLARDFNRMAEQLDSLYRELEQKVDAKTRQLIRSERLAGVGLLAAGVAHEINNPLGIIAGYAEYSLTMLPGRAADEGEDELKRNLRVICDEAFRCKEITTKLLTLASPAEVTADGQHARREVSLAKVAAEVASIVGGLRPYQDRRLIVKAHGQTDGKDGGENGLEPMVLAVEGEMKQVVLNLTLNALEAVPAGGEVRIDLARNGGWVELRVSDNGRGMSQLTLDRVFEPFFTERRGVPGDDADHSIAGGGRRGTGLGLSITHAIVEAHGGRIEAFSDGPGRGSRFIINLPAAPEVSAVLNESKEVNA
jgi:signal transduction histidine kinase